MGACIKEGEETLAILSTPNSYLSSLNLENHGSLVLKQIDCLREAGKEVKGCLPKREGRALNAGCYLMYSTHKFYNEEGAAGDGTGSLRSGGAQLLVLISSFHKISIQEATRREGHMSTAALSHVIGFFPFPLSPSLGIPRFKITTTMKNASCINLNEVPLTQSTSKLWSHL
ncbi:hypothetical protein VNO77_39035 [Canavalia gladiata]|uniref:Uncharacterized protein n=1 Tax=Canavalia gladiata TaxID=3824 RepID=A0AAN9PZD2_CANGL